MRSLSVSELEWFIMMTLRLRLLGFCWRKQEAGISLVELFKFICLIRILLAINFNSINLYLSNFYLHPNLNLDTYLLSLMSLRDTMSERFWS